MKTQNLPKRTLTPVVCLLSIVFCSESMARVQKGRGSGKVTSSPLVLRTSEGVDYSPLKKSLDSIVKKSELGIDHLGLIAAPQNGDPVFAVNESKKFIPASASKIITAAAIIDALLPTFKFHTQVFVDGVQSGAGLKGNIYLKGGGDPGFVSEKMWYLVNEFYRNNIRHIEGKLIVDDSLFDDQAFDTSRESVRVDRAYDAPVGALSFNWNSATLFIRPGSRAGEQAQIWLDPPNDYIRLSGKVSTVSSGHTSIESSKEAHGSYEDVTVTGKILLGAPEQHIYKNVTNPAFFTAAHFREFLRQRGIEITGPAQKGIVPKEARLAADCPSEPLSHLLADMNKFSNNYVAEMLTKDLAAMKVGVPAHLSDGVAQEREFLKKIGIPADQFVFINPSGFTRKNSLTPQQFSTVLRYIQTHFTLYPEFVQSLPIAAVDGTLEKRFHGSGAERWVRAKTGYLDGVVALVGFAGRGDGEVMTFAFMYNGQADEGHVRAVFDELAAALTR